jgi:hypothetical protein
MLGGWWAQRPGIADWRSAHARATAKAAIYDHMTDSDWGAVQELRRPTGGQRCGSTERESVKQSAVSRNRKSEPRVLLR